MEQLEEKIIKAFSHAIRDLGKQPGETYADMLKDFLPSMKDFKSDVKAGVKAASRAAKMVTHPVQSAKDAAEKRSRAKTNENIQENFFSATEFGSHAAKQGLKLHPGNGGDVLAVHPTTKQVHGKWLAHGFGYMLHEPRDAYHIEAYKGIHTSKMYKHPVYESKEQVDEVAGYTMKAHQKAAVKKFFDKEPHNTSTFSTDGKTLESNGMTGTLARHEPDGSVTVTGAYGNVSQTWKNHIEKEAKKRGIKTQSEHNLRPHPVEESVEPSEYAQALMNGKKKISTGWGDKTVHGIHAMLGHDDKDGVADAIMNGKNRVSTDYGSKSREGVMDMIHRHQKLDEAQRLTPLGRRILGAAALGTAISAAPHDVSPQQTITTDKGESRKILTIKPAHKAKGILKSKEGKTYFEYEGGSVFPATK